MPKGIVGKLGVKVAPDLTKFAQELKQKLRKVRETTDFDLPVGLVLDDGDVKQIQERIKRLDATTKIKVALDKKSLKKAKDQIKRLDATIKTKVKVDEASLKRVKDRIRRLGGSGVAPKIKPKVERKSLDDLWKAFENADTKVTPRLDRTGITRIREQLRAQDWPTAEIKPHLDTKKIKAQEEALDRGGVKIRIDLDESSYRRVQERIKRLGERVKIHLHLDESDYHKIKRKLGRLDTSVTVNADADTGKARAKFAWLARRRYVHFQAIADHAALAKVEAYFTRLSGYRALSDWARQAKDVVENMDKLALTMGTAASAALALGSAATALVGTLGALARLLAAIAPAGLALPGIFMGMATGAATLVLSLKDAKDHLSDVGDAFTQVQQNFSAAFWDEAEDSIRSLASDAMPILDAQLTELARAQGQWTAAVADAVHGHLPQLESSLANTAEGARRATRGFGSFTEGLLTIGEVGARYLPMLGDYFSDMGDRFAEWAARAAGDGSIDKAIQRGADAARRSISIMKDLGSAVGAVFKAADKGGYTIERAERSISGFAKALNSMKGQTILTNIFAGAAGGMDALSAAVAKTTDDLVNFSFTLKRSMVDGSVAAGNAWQVLAKVLGNERFGLGVSDFFIGLNKGLRALQRSAPQIGQLLGSILTLGGALAGTVGKVLAKAFEKLGPPVSRLLEALAPLAEALGDWLVQAIEKLSPYITKIIDDFLIPLINKLTESPGLVTALVIAFMGFKGVLGLLPGLLSLASTLIPLISGVEGLGSAILGILGPVGLVIAAILALVAIFVLLWNNSQTFRDTVTQNWEDVKAKVGEAVTAITDWVNNELVPAFSDCWSKISQFWQEYGLPMFQSIDAMVEWLEPIWNGWWNGAQDIVIGVWDVIKGAVIGALNIIQGIFEVVLGVLHGDWDEVWQGISHITSGALSIIQGTISGAFHIIIGLFQWMYTTAWGIVSTMMQVIISILRTGWTFAANATRMAISGMISFITNLPQRIRSIFSGAGSWLLQAGRNIISGLISGIRGSIGRLSSTLGGLTRMIPRWKGPAPVDKRILQPAGRLLIRGLVTGIEDEEPAVRKSLRGLTGRLPGMTVNHEVDGGDFSKSGASITINQYNPVQETDSAVRDKVASGIRLAASL